MSVVPVSDSAYWMTEDFDGELVHTFVTKKCGIEMLTDALFANIKTAAAKIEGGVALLSFWMEDLRVERIIDELAFPSCRYDPRVKQHSEVVGNRTNLVLQQLGDVRHAERPQLQCADYLQSQRVCHRLQIDGAKFILLLVAISRIRHINFHAIRTRRIIP